MTRAKRRRDARPRRPMLWLLVVVAAVSVFMVEFFSRMRHPSREPTRTWIDHIDFAAPSFTERCGPGELRPKLIVYTSPDKYDWVQRGADQFMDLCPNTRVSVVRQPDLQAIAEIEANHPPAVWLPSDDMFVDYLEERWHIEGRPMFARRPSLLHTPMVLMIWPDRARALETLWPEAESALDLLAELSCPGVAREPFAALESTSPRTWADWLAHEMVRPDDPEAVRAWGAIDVLHTLPTQSTTGAFVLLAMFRGYLFDNGSIPVTQAELEDGFEQHEHAFTDWLARCDQRMRDDFDGPPRVLAQRMFQRGPGPTGIDGAFVYENYALEVLDGETEVELLYPSVLTVANHPAVTFPGFEFESAEHFVDVLGGEFMQHQAVRYGLRPGARDIALRDAHVPGAQNPFLRHRDAGVELELDRPETPAPRPSRDCLRGLIEAWSNATGRF